MEITDADMGKYTRFLNDLRKSGRVNMYGAGQYLSTAFGLSEPHARKVLARWMDEFGKLKG